MLNIIDSRRLPTGAIKPAQGEFTDSMQGFLVPCQSEHEEIMVSISLTIFNEQTPHVS
jgi:hypothetical protein